MEVSRTTDLNLPAKPRLMKKHVTIWRSGERAVPERSWSKLKTDYKIKMDKRGNLSVMVPSEPPTWYTGVYQGVRKTLNSTLQESKVALSYFYPRVGFSMQCRAFLQEHPGSPSFGLVVSCYHGDIDANRPGYQLVGGSIHPKYIRTGDIQVSVVSREIEADVVHGEQISLRKIEQGFHGRQFDVQFACKSKGKKIKDGVFGKVIVEQLTENGSTTIFEFNLTKGIIESSESTALPEQDKWSIVPVRELASMLNILEEENWKTLAFNLRFTEHEVQQLSTSSEPFSALLYQYQSRGGSPDHFMTAMYEVSRMLHVGGYVTRGSRSRDIGYQGRDVRFLGDFEDSDEIAGMDSVSQMGPVTVPAVTTTQFNLPLTPPATPRKRQASDDHSPSKRTRRCLLLDDDHDTIILNDEQEVPTSPKSNRIPLKRLSLDSDADTVILEEDSIKKIDESLDRECTLPVGPTTLWYVHNHVQSEWKVLGSYLGIPDPDLDVIANQHKDMKERAYQVLYKWKELFPDRFVYGVLYGALCDSNLQSVADRYCRNRGEPC